MNLASDPLTVVVKGVVRLTVTHAQQAAFTIFSIDSVDAWMCGVLGNVKGIRQDARPFCSSFRL